MKDPRLTLNNVPPPSSPTSGPELHLDTLSTQDEPFAEYLWMEHEEEFNRQVSKEEGQQEEPTGGEVGLGWQLEEEADLFLIWPFWIFLEMSAR